jgi:hypothetical protein
MILQRSELRTEYGGYHFEQFFVNSIMNVDISELYECVFYKL